MLAPLNQHGGIKRCICTREVRIKIAYGGSNLQLSIYKFHKKVQQLFFLSYGNEIHTCAAVKNKSKILYSKSCILYHITYTTIKTLHYQPLRFILTFKSNRNMVSFGMEHCKYDIKGKG